ncbi:MAG: FCD domain-containing protein [Candidatus Caldatribacteriaceae bacterium]
MEVRKLYELYCLEEYFDRINREKLSACLKRCRKRNTFAEGEEFEQLDDHIHSLIVKASENVFLIGSYNNIKDLIVLIRHLIRGQTHRANEEHIALLEGDRERAKGILKDHIDQVARSIFS